jgi:hypothetical protein
MGFLDFFHRPKNKITTIKITTFRKLVLLPSSGKRWGVEWNTYSVGSLALSKGPNRVGVPLFPPPLTRGRKQKQFPKRRNFNCSYFILRTIGKSPKNPLLHVMKSTEFCVVINEGRLTDEYNVTVNSEESTSTTEYLTL